MSEVVQDLIAEVRRLLGERLAERRARDDAMEGGLELGAREDRVDDARGLAIVQRLAGYALHHLMLHERAADRLGQRPGEHVVDRTLSLGCREQALGHPLEPPPRVELGFAPGRANSSTRPRTNGSPSTIRTGQSIDLPASRLHD